MASAQTEIMNQVRAIIDISTNNTISNLQELRSQRLLNINPDDFERVCTMIRNSADQSFSNSAGSLIRLIDGRITK